MFWVSLIQSSTFNSSARIFSGILQWLKISIRFLSSGIIFFKLPKSIFLLWAKPACTICQNFSSNSPISLSDSLFKLFKGEQCRASITQDDLVIICLTEATRVYFFKDFPVISAAESIHHVDPLVRSTITKDQLLAIKYYQTYFEHIHMHKMKFHLLNFLHSANALAAELKIKIIIIDSVLKDNIDCNRYKNLIISNGSLVNVSDNEAVDHKILPTIHLRGDKRPNHLCRSNHAILAKKVVDTITTNVALDLTLGFNEKIIKELTFSPEI